MLNTLQVLVSAELLGSVRRRWLTRLSHGRLLSPRWALVAHTTVPLAFALLFYALPIIVLHQVAQNSSSTVASTLPLVVNCSSVFFLYFGLFVGAYLLCGYTVSLNEEMLAYPITIRDVARLRLLEVMKSSAATAYFVVLPTISFQCLANGWQTPVIVIALIVALLAFIAIFLVGALLMMGLLRYTGRWSPESVFIAAFLCSAALLVFALQALRWPTTAGSAATMLHAANDYLRPFTVATLAFGSATAPKGGSLLVLVGYAVLLVPVVVTLVTGLEQVVTLRYAGIHRGLPTCLHEHPAGTQAASRPGYNLDYKRLSGSIHIFPLSIRVLLARDILFIVRNPRLPLKMLSVAIPLAVLPYARRLDVQAPLVFDLYFFSAFLAFRLFVNSAGLDAESWAFTRYGFASAAHYLGARVAVLVLGSIAFLTPVWVCLGSLAGWGGLLGGISTLALLSLNLVTSALLVVCYVTCFSGHRRVGWRASDTAVSPVALMAYCLIGLPGPAFFYMCDLGIRGSRVHLGLSGWLAGTVALTLTVVFAAFATRYAERRD